MITFRSGSFITEKELLKEKKNLNFYHIPKPIFYFSNVELNKKNYSAKRTFKPSSVNSITRTDQTDSLSKKGEF